MTSTRETRQHDPEDQNVDIQLQELVLSRSRKTHDVYSVACRLEQAGDVLNLVLDVRDERVFLGEVSPLIKHSLHVAFTQLANATVSNISDDADEPPKPTKTRWHFDLQSLHRDPAKDAFALDFKFRGPKKARGKLTVESKSLDDAWCAIPMARDRAHEIFCRAGGQTQSWKLNYEELEEL
jgi:hypothetical protein